MFTIRAHFLCTPLKTRLVSAHACNLHGIEAAIPNKPRVFSQPFTAAVFWPGGRPGSYLKANPVGFMAYKVAKTHVLL